MVDDREPDEGGLGKENNVGKISRGALQVVGGAVPFAGGFFQHLREHGLNTSNKKPTVFLSIGYACLKMKSKKKNRRLLK